MNNETGREPTDAETVCTYPDCRCPVDAAEGFCLKGLPIHGPDETAQTSLRAECEHGHLARKCETCALIEREAECERLRAEVEKLQKDRDRLWQDRYDLLSVTSTDGLLSSEWVMRSATAERKAKDMEAANTRLTARVAELEAELDQITVLAHFGGLRNLSESNTLIQIRRLTKRHFKPGRMTSERVNILDAALAKAKSATGKDAPDAE